MNLVVVGVAIVAYFIGAIPTGYIIAQLKGIADIRTYGSGNIGATNVSRVLGVNYFFLVFFLDAGKAFLFMHAMSFYFPAIYLYFFGCMLLLGNGISPFLYGSGGKGVSTLFGLLAVVHPYAIFIALLLWISVLLTIKIVGVASALAAWSLPVYGFLFCSDRSVIFFLLCAAWITFTHRSNIAVFWKQYCIKK